MAFVVLDIGAGSLSFAWSLQFYNLTKNLLVFAGEPHWGWLKRTCIDPVGAQRLISRGCTGRYRVVSEYQKFAFPDKSIDLVTLNAPHPIFGPWGIEKELIRCLKPGGLFLYSFPLCLWEFSAKDEKKFESLAKGSWRSRWPVKVTAPLPKGAPAWYPPSWTVRNAVWTKWLRVHRPEHYESLFSVSQPRESYMYQDGVAPGYRLWQKK